MQKQPRLNSPNKAIKIVCLLIKWMQPKQVQQYGTQTSLYSVNQKLSNDVTFNTLTLANKWELKPQEIY